MSNERLRCVVVGYGGLSRAMRPLLGEQPWFDAVGVVDIDDDALRRGESALGVPRSATYRKLAPALAELSPDAVIVNTPSECHFELSKEALEAGAHVLVAKPVTNSFEEAVELVDVADASPGTLSVGQQIRYNRHYTAVRKFVESGRLGDVEAVWFMNSKPRPNPANLKEMDQPALYENACHHFDSFLSILGDAVPEWISSDGFIPSWSPYTGPCMANALIRFSRGLHISYHGGFSSQSTMYEFRLEGTEGALCCHGLHMSNDTMSYEFAPALGKFADAPIDADVPLVRPFVPLLEIWYDYLRGGPEPPFSGRNNLRVFALLSAAIQSIEEGRPVEVAGSPRFAKAFG